MLLFMMYYTNGKNGSALGVSVYAVVMSFFHHLFTVFSCRYHALMCQIVSKLIGMDFHDHAI